MVESGNDSKKDLWELIEEEYSEGFSVHDFRKLGGFNERLGSWGPIIENSRYFKSLLLEFAKYLDNKFLSEFNISSRSKYFFSKNAVCKYHPSSVDIKKYNIEQYEAVLKMGLCRDVIDIYDDQKLKIAKENYVQKYCPKHMKTIKSQDCFGQYNYYYSVLYSS
jgi:hypothetical protein